MIGVVAAVLAGYGVFLVYTSTVLGWRGLRVGPSRAGASRTGASGAGASAAGASAAGASAAGAAGPSAGAAPRLTVRQRLDRAGLYDVAPGELLASMGLLAVVGGGISYVLFGSVPPAVVGAGFAATLPVAAFRERRQRRLEAAAESWPRMLEELRLLTGSVGRSIPQALFEVGRRAPEPLRPAFEAAEREWMLTTDFDRTAQLLKQRLADPTADTVCETLVVAHHVGGGGLDHRLAELIEDRILELQGRKDAASKQAGVRFARRFVLVVPLGMALAGLSIGTGRASYETASGQLAVVAGLLAVVVCWYWSGRLMQVPGEPRVFLDAQDADLDRVTAGR